MSPLTAESLLTPISYALLRSPAVSFLVAMGVSLLAGPIVIRLLRRYVRESIKSDSKRLNELHAAKKDTPTMGGVLIVLAFVAGTVIAGPVSPRVFWPTILSALALMILGAVDDWIKRTTSLKGLTARQKLAGQIGTGLLASAGIYACRQDSISVSSSFIGSSLVVPILFVLWSTFVITATSNAVNLTDGLDGLASGCTIMTATTIALLLTHDDSSDRVADVQQARVLLLALSGSCLGFLWFNRHPAKVFMGDAGSLPIGGILAVTALACGAEFLLAICGGVFVIETLSVLIQVFWYRRTKTRILLCSPLHNHFVFRGSQERRIVYSFWLASGLFCLAGLLAANWFRWQGH